MQAGDSLRVSNVCEMVQISTRLSRFFRLAWPPASENGAATTMDENKLLAGRFLQWKASDWKNANIAKMCGRIRVKLHMQVSQLW
jgi:hypothetical protein